MPDLAHIQAEIALLQAKADAIREAEFEPVVEQIKAEMKAFGITPEDLGTKNTYKATKKSRLSVRAEGTLAEQAVAEPIAAAPEPIAIQIAEYRNRKNLCPYELAMMYQRAIEDGLFPSNKKMAASLGVSLQAVGQALKLARLPLDVVAAFPSPLDLQYRWGAELQKAIDRDRDSVIEEARQIQSESLKPTAKEVLARLIAAADGPALSGDVTPEPVGPKVPASDVTLDEISDAAADASDEEVRRAKKARKATYDKADREANPEKRRALDAEKSRRFRAANPDHIKAYNKAYHAANSDATKARNAAYRAANSDATKARNAAYRVEHRAELNKKERARYQAKKLEKLAALQAQTTAATAAVEPAEVENVVPPTKKPFDSWAFVASMYKTPKDLQETLDKMTPRQIARAQRRFRPS